MSETKTKAKGTPKTEAIIGASSNKIVTAVKSLSDAVANAMKLPAILEEQALQVADYEDKLTNLATEYSNRKTQQRIDLDLAYKADQREFAEQYMGENNLVPVPRDTYQRMEKELAELTANFNERVKAEVGKERGMCEAAIKNAENTTRLTYEAKEANNLARIQTLEQQLTFITEQSKHWETQLNAERTASVERAKAGAVGNINVTSPGR